MTALYDRNREFFHTRFPALATMLDRVDAPVSQLVRTGADDWDIVTHDVPLYGGVRDYIRRQMATMDGPDWTRIASAVPIPPPFRAILDGIDPSTHPVRREGFHLVSMGLGLGLHLPQAVELTGACSVIIVEHNLEFLCHSLQVLDWNALAQRVNLQIITDAKPEAVLDQLQQCFGKAGAALIDGTHILYHTPDLMFRTVVERFRQDPNSTLLCHGDIYDEIRMVRNSYLNLKRDDAVVWRGSNTSRDWPVMIVGSGPSLDGMLDDVRRLAPHCLVVAAGTALPVLLRNGIVPDFCTILENTAYQYDVFAEYRLQWPEAMSRITVLGSSTMDPRIIDLFNHTVLAIRSHVASTPLFGYDEAITAFNIAPTVTNMALGLFLGSGYRDFILFGTDFGSRQASHHHSKDSPYMTSAMPFNTKDAVIRVRGNLGGTILCHYIFNWARTMVEAVLALCEARRIPVTVRNCSDGALIRGTKPTLARKLVLPIPPTDKAAAVADFTGDFAPYGPDAFARVWDLRGLLDHLSALDTAFQAAFQHTSPFAPMDALSTVLQSDTPLIPLIRGSVTLQLMALQFLRNRLGESASFLWPSLLDAQRTMLDALIAEARHFIRDLDAGAIRGPWLRLIGGGPPTEW